MCECIVMNEDRFLRVQTDTRCIVRCSQVGMHGPERPQPVRQGKERYI